MLLYVTRHGLTDFNLENRYMGGIDAELNAMGLHQAELTAEKLANTVFDVIVSSPLRRAAKTAQIIAERHPDVPIVYMPELTERHMGVYEGLTRDEVKERYPELYAADILRRINGAPPGGETLLQFDLRVISGMEKLLSGYADKTVLAVCHGFTSRMINKYVNGLNYTEMNGFLLDNCEVVMYDLS